MNSDPAESDPLSKEARALNARAHSALIGWDRDWRSSLIDLLRSEYPIGLALRDVLADAIEGTSQFGIKLTLSGHERSARWWESISDRREWFVNGPIVQPFIHEAENLPAGIENAAENLGRSEAYCKKTYYYWRDCSRWMRDARSQGRCYAAMDDNLLSLEFHISSIEQKTLKPRPMPGAEFDEAFSQQWQSLSRLVDSMDIQDGPGNGLVNFLYWLERVPYQGP